MSTILQASNPEVANLANAEQDTRTALRFVTCGSVDDGKSTLIGRLLVDSRAVLQDQLASVQRSGTPELTRSSADFPTNNRRARCGASRGTGCSCRSVKAASRGSAGR